MSSLLDDDENSIEAEREIIRNLVRQVAAQDDLILREANDRHIMFVGRTRSGKSTVYEVLKSPYIFVSKTSIFSVTNDARINHFTIEHTNEQREKVNYNISIIDTPGLFEIKKVGDPSARDNKTLEEIILKCLNSEITKIHAIFFVASFNEGVNKDDVEALKSFVTLFAGAEKNIWMLITRAESMTEANKERTIQELREHRDLAELCKIVDGRILFSGAVEQAYVDNGETKTFKNRLNSVLKMRQSLFKEIFGMKSSFELNLLGKVDEMKIDVDRKLKLITEFGEITNDNLEELQSLCYMVGARRLIYPDRNKLDSILSKVEERIKKFQNRNTSS